MKRTIFVLLNICLSFLLTVKINCYDKDVVEKKTMHLVLDKLESFVINHNETSGITMDEIVKANNEFDCIEPRSLIRLRRKEPSLNCVSRLIVMALLIDDSKIAINRMESNYKLLREKCKSGLVDYFTGQGSMTQLFVRSLLWEENGAQKIDEKLISDAKSEYDDFIHKYYSFESKKENVGYIEWLIQYFNSYEVRILSKYIFPIWIFDLNKLKLDDANSITLKDIFTDQMRYNGFLVTNGEYNYRNYDIDHVE